MTDTTDTRANPLPGIAGLRLLLAKATPGPLVATERQGYHEILAPDETCDWYGREKMHAVFYCDTEIDEDEQRANAALIVALRNNAEAFLSRIEELEEGLEPFAGAADEMDRATAALPLPPGAEMLSELATIPVEHLCRARSLLDRNQS